MIVASLNEDILRAHHQSTKSMPNRQSASKSDRSSDGDSKGRIIATRYQALCAPSSGRRRKSCPFSGPNAPTIDYKDIKLLQRFTTERGKIDRAHFRRISEKAA